MAKIEDALPNETVTDEAFVEQEVTVPEDTVPNTRRPSECNYGRRRWSRNKF